MFNLVFINEILGKINIGSHIYSYSSISVLRYKSLMPRTRNVANPVLTTLLKKHLAVVMSEFGVDVSPA